MSSTRSGGRSRSSTLLSQASSLLSTGGTSSQPANTALDLDDLSSTPKADSSDTQWRDAQMGGQSWKSAHSMKTLRGNNTGETSDDDDELPSAAPSYPQVNSINPQRIIDLTPSASLADSAPPNGRPRASTFGGVAIPETPIPTTTTPPSPSPPLAQSHSGPTHLHLLPPRRPRASSNASSISLRLGGGTFSERRPVLAAGLKGAALFAGSVLGLWVLLRTLLPPIEEQHKEAVRLPKSFEQLKELNAVLQIYKETNYWRVLGCYITVYLFLQAFSIPGSMYLSILGGAMYGVLMALPLVCACVSTGALLCYLISAQLGPAVLLNSEKWQLRVDKWSERIASHGDNLVSYLIVLRIAPLPPHWVVNVVAPHLGISIWTFWISTFFGIMGVSFIHTQIGTTLDQMTSAGDFNLISWQNGLGLGGICLAVLVPVFLRQRYSKDLAEAAIDVDPSLPSTSSASSSSSSNPHIAIHLPDDRGGGGGGGGFQRDSKAHLQFLDGVRARNERERQQQAFSLGGDSDGLSDEEDVAEGQGRGQKEGKKGKGRPRAQHHGGQSKASRVLGVDVDHAHCAAPLVGGRSVSSGSGSGSGSGVGGNEAGWGGR